MKDDVKVVKKNENLLNHFHYQINANENTVGHRFALTRRAKIKRQKHMVLLTATKTLIYC